MQLNEVTKANYPKLLLIIAIASYLIALAAFYFHAIKLNPQSDNQVIYYSIEFINAFKNGTLSEYFLMVRKYPFFYTLTYTVPYEIVKSVINVHPILLAHYFGRLMSVLFALGTFLIIKKYSISRSYFLCAAMLLMTSQLFFMFATAIRPHALVAFWAMLSLFFSLRLSERKTYLNIILAYAPALAAFCTLQNGIFVFIFPIWGYVYGDLKSLKTWIKCGMWTIFFLALSPLIGYTFLLGKFFGGGSGEVGFDLGHDAGNVWNFSGFPKMLRSMVGSEPILLIFALWGIIRLIRKKDSLTRKIIPVLLFVAAYYIVFSIYGGGTKERYFVIAMPMLALIGASALDASHKAIKIGLLILITLMFAKFAYLGFSPNTYESASNFINGTEGPVGTDLPPYFLSIPNDRYQFESESDIKHIITVRDKHELDHTWQTCFEATSSSSSERMFLWEGVQWGFIRLFEAKMLGPSLVVYCKNNS